MKCRNTLGLSRISLARSAIMNHESEQEIEAKLEQRTEAEPEKEQIRELEITEPTVSIAMSTTRSSDSGVGRG